MKIVKPMLWVVLFLMSSCWGCWEKERASLLDFKEGIDFTVEYGRGPPSKLESWRGLNCCKWEGVSCHQHTGHVVTLDLPGRMMVWTDIRPGLFQLEHLEYLDLSGNYFETLSIPSQLVKLNKLRYLNLGGCRFSGQIPREIGNLSSLRFLDLSFNQDLESRNLGVWMKNLTRLEHLALYLVNLTMGGNTWGEAVTSLTNLRRLDMHMSGIWGVIPPSIANLSQLEWLQLSGNSLRGKIPAFGAPLSLSFIDLSENNLESLPSSFSGLSKLSWLGLRSNRLSGSIPSNLGNLTSLVWLDLWNNSLNGTIPTSVEKLFKLEYFDLSDNRLGGTFSLSLLDNLYQIKQVRLSNNLLTVKVSDSSIPKFQLQELSMRSCNVEGNFPAFISMQYFITYLDLSNNSLGGTIPDWLWDLTHPYYLNLSSNHFVGGLPFGFLGAADDQSIFDLSKNKLQGNVPLFHPNLMFLDLSDNLFDGSILTNIEKYEDGLIYLSLAKNNLRGTIPDSLCELQNLQFLDLSNNRLTGNIPSSLKNCSLLSVLNLEKNGFKEKIPDVFWGM